ncbi:unnamed protein product [Sphagnum balticum]
MESETRIVTWDKDGNYVNMPKSEYDSAHTKEFVVGSVSPVRLEVPTGFTLPAGANGLFPLKLGTIQWNLVGGGYSMKPDNYYGIKLAAEINKDCVISIPTKDFSVPDTGRLIAGLYCGITLAQQQAPIWVGCMAGRGRTGLYFAALAKVMAKYQKLTKKKVTIDPVAYTREHYYSHAVETAEQKKWVEDLNVDAVAEWAVHLSGYRVPGIERYFDKRNRLEYIFKSESMESKLETKTIADYRARPHTSNCDFGSQTVAETVVNYQQYLSKGVTKNAKPEELAIYFYLLNAACAAIMQQVDKNQPLTKEQLAILDFYYAALEEIGYRTFFYLFLICTREARHWHQGKAVKELTKKYGKYVTFFGQIPDSSSHIINHLASAAFTTKFTLKEFTNLLYDVFNEGDFSSSFGGKKWAQCTQPLRDFVNGGITMEMLLDTAWTLAHNTGPIFNKGMLFATQDNAELLKILDVQRAGQIPNLVMFKESTYVTPDHLKTLVMCQKALPDFGNEAVNWQKVVDLGAKGSYGVKKSKAVYPGKAKEPSSLFGLGVEPSKVFQVNTTQAVKKITRAETK